MGTCDANSRNAGTINALIVNSASITSVKKSIIPIKRKKFPIALAILVLVIIHKVVKLNILNKFSNLIRFFLRID